jgi:hypothetical protein
MWPLAGMVALLFAFFKYTLLDGVLIYWIGAVPCLLVYTLINVAWRRKAGDICGRFSHARSGWQPAVCFSRWFLWSTER